MSREEDLELCEAAMNRERGKPPFIDLPESTKSILTLLYAMCGGYEPRQDQLEWARESFIKGIAQVERLRIAGEAVLHGAYLDDNVINRHASTSVSCKALRQLAYALGRDTGPENPQ